MAVGKCLPAEALEPEIDSQHPLKTKPTYITSVLGEQRQANLWAHWLDSLAELINSKFSRRPCVKNKVKKNQGKYPVLASDLHMHTLIPAHI